MGAELQLLEYLRGTRSNPNSSNTALAGDLVVKLTRNAGSYNAAVSCFYHGERSP